MRVARGARRFFVFRRGRVTYVGVASPRVVARRRALRGHLRRLGIIGGARPTPPLLRP